MGFFDFLREDDAGADGPGATGSDAAGAADATADESPPTPLAEEFAADGPSGLDFTPGSLARLDEHVADRAGTDGEDRDADRAMAAYLGEVFVREYDAHWRRFDDLGWIVEVPAGGDGGRTVLPLPTIVADCLGGEATFGLVHDSVVAELGLSGPEVAGPPPGGSPDSPLSDAAESVLAERAEALAAEHPDYDLDFTPASFARLDDLVAEAYDQSPDGVDRDVLAAESPPGGVPEGASLRIGQGGAAGRIAAYAGEVYRRTYTAEWHDGDGVDVLVVHGVEGSVELEPAMLASASFAGHVSFDRLHGALAEQVGLVP